jgi:hypothetical protein
MTTACCRPFQALLEAAGTPGFSAILLEIDHAVAAMLVCRSAPQPTLGGKQIHYQWPIQHCPFCGTNIATWFSDHPADAERWTRVGESMRSLIIPDRSPAD